VLCPPGKTLTDCPYLEAKEIVGGYVLITANDYANALEVARGCPGLDWGMKLNVGRSFSASDLECLRGAIAGG
jgi:hypothetical protein